MVAPRSPKAVNTALAIAGDMGQARHRVTPEVSVPPDYKSAPADPANNNSPLATASGLFAGLVPDASARDAAVQALIALVAQAVSAPVPAVEPWIGQDEAARRVGTDRQTLDGMLKRSRRSSRRPRRRRARYAAPVPVGPRSPQRVGQRLPDLETRAGVGEDEAEPEAACSREAAASSCRRGELERRGPGRRRGVDVSRSAACPFTKKSCVEQRNHGWRSRLHRRRSRRPCRSRRVEQCPHADDPLGGCAPP